MARETAAALRTTYKMPSLEYKVSNSANITEELKVEVKNQTLLPLARTTANGTIPNQVHIQELKAILDLKKTLTKVSFRTLKSLTRL